MDKELVTRKITVDWAVKETASLEPPKDRLWACSLGTEKRL